MTPGARHSAIIKLYDMVAEAGRPADQILHQYFKFRKFVGSKDRKFIAEAIYTMLRHYARLNWWAEKLNVKPDGRALVLIWLRVGIHMNMDEIAALFDGEGYSPDPLTEHELAMLQPLRQRDFMPADMPENIRLECPDWAYHSLKETFGDGFEAAMEAMQNEAPLDIRVNTLKSDRAAVSERLRQDGFDIVETAFSPLGLRVQGRPPFSAHPYYQQGWMEIQDEGSQILSLACGVKPGEWVVDFCAGAGGKTLALAAQMENKGRIWACDVEARRLENSRKRLRRAGVHCVEMQVLDDEEDDWVRKHKHKADCVMIDAPCSGVGTWRRNPFMRWQKMGLGLETLVALQQSILQSASRLVKPGGRLVYATCSLLPEENQKQVDAFLAQNDDFIAEPLQVNWQASGFDVPQGIDLSQASLQLAPHLHHTDGFFVSAMRRRA